MKVYYDLSRLIDRFAAPRPSGIDRVDLRYALWTRQWAAEWVGLRQHPNGLSLLDMKTADELLSCLGRRWLTNVSDDLKVLSPSFDDEWVKPGEWEVEAKLAILEKSSRVGLFDRCRGRGLKEWFFYMHPGMSRRALKCGRVFATNEPILSPDGFYWNIGHCFRFEVAATEIANTFGAKCVIFLHDAIPLLHPATQRKVSYQHFYQFYVWLMQKMGPRLLLSSQAVLKDVKSIQSSFQEQPGLPIQDCIQLPLPSDLRIPEAGALLPGPSADNIYFVALGRWEPRKNFELLLDVWERLESSSDQRIILRWVGDRGEIPRSSRARLARLEAAGRVESVGVISDTRIKEIFSGARALLFPSSAEGWGLPMTEAFACGLPVIASNLPICREVTQELADYIEPDRINDWEAIVLDYAADNSSLRSAQVRRMSKYQGLSWDVYFERLSVRLDS